MNAWRKFEEMVKPRMLVAIFILLLLFGFYKEAHAEVSVEVGPTFLSGEFSDGGGLLVNETFNDKWRIGMGFISEQEVTDRSDDTYHVRNNLLVHGQRLVPLTRNLDLGIGVGYFNAKTRWNGSNFVASLSMEYSLNDKWSINYRHWSNAGSASPNMGQDLFTVGYRF